MEPIKIHSSDLAITAPFAEAQWLVKEPVHHSWTPFMDMEPQMQEESQDMAGVRDFLQQVSAALSFRSPTLDIQCQGPNEVAKLVDSSTMYAQKPAASRGPANPLVAAPHIQVAQLPAATSRTNVARRGKWDQSKGQSSSESQASSGSNDADVTTIMIRGIPCSLTTNCLMEILDRAGLAGVYDFFYLPPSKIPDSNDTSKPKGNLGYAFVNFVHPTYVTVCKEGLHGVKLDPVRSNKVCTISAADIQGIRNLRKHFRKTLVSKTGYGPIFLKTQQGAGVLYLDRALAA